MVKPGKLSTARVSLCIDGVQRGLVGEISKRFEARGFQLVALKLVKPTQSHLETHYQDLKSKSFFPGTLLFVGFCDYFD